MYQNYVIFFFMLLKNLSFRSEILRKQVYLSEPTVVDTILKLYSKPV